MTSKSLRTACAAAVLAALGAASLASRAESFASSASSAGSASSGSLSDSVRGSSRSSTSDDKVADGDYRVVVIAALADRPGMLRLQLLPRDAASGDTSGALQLDLPGRALGEHGMAAGDIVQVQNRAYGLEFARAATREPFFLALKDDWRGELDPRPVAL